MSNLLRLLARDPTRLEEIRPRAPRPPMPQSRRIAVAGTPHSGQERADGDDPIGTLKDRVDPLKRRRVCSQVVASRYLGSTQVVLCTKEPATPGMAENLSKDGGKLLRLDEALHPVRIILFVTRMS